MVPSGYVNYREEKFIILTSKQHHNVNLEMANLNFVLLADLSFVLEARVSMLGV